MRCSGYGRFYLPSSSPPENVYPFAPLWRMVLYHTDSLSSDSTINSDWSLSRCDCYSAIFQSFAPLRLQVVYMLLAQKCELAKKSMSAHLWKLFSMKRLVMNCLWDFGGWNSVTAQKVTNHPVVQFIIRMLQYSMWLVATSQEKKLHSIPYNIAVQKAQTSPNI